jgi:hypothetical protein
MLTYMLEAAGLVLIVGSALLGLGSLKARVRSVQMTRKRREYLARLPQEPPVTTPTFTPRLRNLPNQAAIREAQTDTRERWERITDGIELEPDCHGAIGGKS